MLNGAPHICQETALKTPCNLTFVIRWFLFVVGFVSFKFFFIKFVIIFWFLFLCIYGIHLCSYCSSCTTSA